MNETPYTPRTPEDVAQTLASRRMAVNDYQERIGAIIAPEVLEEFYKERGWL